MKKIKLISVVMVTIIFACSMLSVSANTSVKVNDEKEKMTFELSEGLILNENISKEQQLFTVANSNVLSEKQKGQALEKISSLVNNSELKSSETYRLDTTTYNLTIAIPYFRQINTYFCGPATTQQSIEYILGMSHHQEEIAEALGTTTAGTDGMRIVAYMNSQQNDVYYIDVTPTDEADMASRIYRGMSYYGSAPILRLTMYQSQGWSYYSSGHFMNASGIYSTAYSTSGALQYEVTDPYIQYINPSETDGKYRINSTAVYNSTMNHFAQEFYY